MQFKIGATRRFFINEKEYAKNKESCMYKKVRKVVAYLLYDIVIVLIFGTSTYTNQSLSFNTPIIIILLHLVV